MNMDAQHGGTLRVCVRDDAATRDTSVLIKAFVRVFRVYRPPPPRPVGTNVPPVDTSGEQYEGKPTSNGSNTPPADEPTSKEVRTGHTSDHDGCAQFHGLEDGWYRASARIGDYVATSEDPDVYVRQGSCETLNVPMHTRFTASTYVINDQCEPVPCTDFEIGKSFVVRVGHRRDLGRLHIKTDGGFGRQLGAMREYYADDDRLDNAEERAAAAKGGDTATRYSEFVFTPERAGANRLHLTAEGRDGEHLEKTSDVMVRENVQRIGGDISVTLRRTAAELTTDLPLWVVIRNSTNALSFNNYAAFMNHLLCGARESSRPNPLERLQTEAVGEFHRLAERRFLPYTDADAYRVLKIATEAFVMVNCGVFLDAFPFTDEDREYMLRKVGLAPELAPFWDRYLQQVNGARDATLPYLALVREKLKDVSIKTRLFEDPERLPPRQYQDCTGILQTKLSSPCLLELIWSYWHEEGMMVQTINAVTRRFQNVRVTKGGLDPLGNFEVDPLRPLNNLLWAHVQDEQHRLSVVRRNYEYAHEYGLRLEGRALGDMRAADTRSKFLEAFHNLLHRATVFYKQDDNTTIVADGFPVLNALKEVHLILAEGAHNQFGDLPSTARVEMLMQQWLLARPEFREFLPTRIMVAYPEPWMDRVDAMKRLQGWTDTNVLNFRNLGVFGEQLLLTIRYGNWSDVHDAAQGANWARFWRPEVQGYVHAYRAVVGVDVSVVSGDARVDATLPSTLLRRRLATQQQPRPS